MPIGSLRVYLIDARIEFDGRDARMDIRQPPSRVDIARNRGEVEAEAEHPQLELDSSQCEAEENHKTVAELTAEFADEGRSDAREAAQQINAEGRQMLEHMPDEKGVRAQIADSKAFPQFSAPELAFVPSQPPHMKFTPNRFHYQITPDTLDFSWKVAPMAQVDVAQPAQLNIRMVRYPGVEVDYVPSVSALDEKA